MQKPVFLFTIFKLLLLLSLQTPANSQTLAQPLAPPQLLTPAQPLTPPQLLTPAQPLTPPQPLTPAQPQTPAQSQTPGQSLPLCRTQCGAVSIKYPFGLDNGCGAPEYYGMLNCSMDLLFQTPSGSYKVRSIDYDKNTMVIYDPAMSTCTMMQPRHDFLLSDIQNIVIQPSSDTVFALLNCSIDSPVLNRYRSLCFNFSGHSCDELYTTCSSFKVLHMLTAGYPSCCFTEYTTLKFMSMNILDCSHYTTVYGLDDLKGVGPMDWQYGIEMSFGVPNTGCEHCQRSGGTCGYNTETQGMLCLCSTGFNSTRECGNVTGGGRRPSPTTVFQVAFAAVAAFMRLIF